MSRCGGRPAALALALVAALTVIPAAAGDAAARWPIRDEVAATPDAAGDLEVEGRGWGHSVGMSQYGARAQALAGRSVDQILGHYYPGTTLGTRPTQDSDAVAGRPIRVGLVSAVPTVDLRLVSGSVTWLRCDIDEVCTPITGVSQGPGQTLTVSTGTAAGTLEIRRGSTSIAQVSVADGAFIAADHDGSVMEGPNPNTANRRAEYRHGRTEVARLGDRIAVTQRVPNVEWYLRGLAEMPSSWEAAALQSQAVVGRTYAVRALTNAPRAGCRCHLQASPADQAYTGWNKENEAPGWGARWTAAVVDTAGRVVTYQGNLAQTFYSSSHGGRTENVEDSWAYGSEPIPYLRSVDDPWSIDPAVGNPRASWSATLPAPRLRTLVSDDLRAVTGVTVRDRTAGGTPRTLRFTGYDAAGQQVQIDWPSGGKPAGARLRAAYGAGLLPSQQLTSIRVGTSVPLVDIDTSPHAEAIRWAYTAGVTTGVTATHFDPRRPVSREQMASFLHRTFDLPAGDGGRFLDVEPRQTHEAAIGALATSGITQGCDTQRFCPRDLITRAQMASFLTRALDLPASSPSFVDVNPGSHHSNAIGALAASGITAGCDADRFCPDEPVTREQMTRFLYRVVRGA